jgi:hypothetical protein
MSSLRAADRRRPHARLAFALALLAVLALDGCGGSASPGASATSGLPAGSRAVVSASADSPSRARAYADAVDLRPADVPQLEVVAASTALGSSQEGGKGECGLHVSTRGRIAGVLSDRFRSGTAKHGVSVESAVEVMPSAARASAEVRSLRTVLGSASGRGCLARELGHASSVAAARGAGRRVSVKDTGVRLASIDLGSAVAGGGVAGFSVSFVMHFVLPTPSGPRSFALHMRADRLYAAVGNAEISLVVTGTGEVPPSALEAHLFSLLVERAVAGEAPSKD